MFIVNIYASDWPTYTHLVGMSCFASLKNTAILKKILNKMLF